MSFVLLMLLYGWLSIVELALVARTVLSVLLRGHPRYVATVVHEVLVHVWQTRVVNW